nr:hypothetical protein B0A51_16600 [Rachicladosporium sp. CCFEE 5018]
MAATTTLSIPELLESILLLVDPNTVLLAQRVNKTFCATIRGSEKLQIMLFFKQASADPNKPHIKPHRPKYRGVPYEGMIPGPNYNHEETPGLNTFHLTSTGPYWSCPVPHWRKNRTAYRWTEASSALDMYPSSIPGAEYWGDYMEREGRVEKPSGDETCEEQTLRQFLKAHGRWSWVYGTWEEYHGLCGFARVMQNLEHDMPDA